MTYDVRRDADGVYIVLDGDRELVELVSHEPNWWTGRRLPNGQVRRLYERHDGTEQGEIDAAQKVAVRLL